MMKVALQVSHHLVSKWVENDNIFLIFLKKTAR